MEISIASDHAGFKYKTLLTHHLQSKGHEATCFSTDSEESVDYPDFLKSAVVVVSLNSTELGIVLGSSGNGEAIAANKVKGALLLGYQSVEEWLNAKLESD